MIENILGVSLVFVLQIIEFRANLIGNEQIDVDVTSNPVFGCRWTGGTDIMVNCTCRSDAEDFVIKKGEIPTYDTWSIEINNCKKVTFEDKSIEDLRNLRKLHLRSISSLNFHPESLNWFGYKANYHEDNEFEYGNIPSLKILIENSNIDKISQHTFKGIINSIDINNCNINEVESFAFSSLYHTKRISLMNNVINKLKPQSFKLFTTDQLILDNITLETIPSRSFSSIKVRDSFKILNSKLGTIYSSAFVIEDPKSTEIFNNKIEILDGEGFVLTTKGDVTFKKNNFDVVNDGSFIKITLSNDFTSNNPIFLIFNNNYFENLHKNSLESGLFLKIIDLKLNNTCECERLFSTFSKSLHSEIKCLKGDEYVSLKDYKSSDCTILSSHLKTIVVIGTILLLIVIVAILLAVYFHRQYKEGKYGGKKDKKNVSLIVPDGRTYRETEVHVIVERVDLLTTDL